MVGEHLVVVVPGIGGSVLEDASGRIVWGGWRRRGGGRWWPALGRLSVEESPSLVATGLTETVGWFPPLQIPGYSALTKALPDALARRDASGRVIADSRPVVDVAVEGRERNLRARVVLFPYDFRVSVATAAERLAGEVAARFEGVAEENRTARVLVVGHSMGGLVARCWLAAHPEHASWCAAVLTVGTPFRGASKALEWLVNGATVAGVPLPAVSRLLRGWPGMFDLLPTYEVIRDAAAGTTTTPARLAGPGAPGFAADPTFALGASRAARLHEEMADAWADRERMPLVVPFYSRGHGTLHVASMEEGRLRVVKEDPEWQPGVGSLGDGTVPFVSAIPPELTDERGRALWHQASQRHGPMAGAKGVVASVRALTSDDLGAVRGRDDAETGTWLGVDVDDVCLAGSPIQVLARQGEQATGGTVWVTFTPLDEASRLPDVSRRVRVHATEASGAWQARLTPPTSGAWQVEVQAVGPGSGEPPSVADVVAVVDPDEMGTIEHGGVS